MRGVPDKPVVGWLGLAAEGSALLSARANSRSFASTPATAKTAVAGDPGFAQDDTLEEHFFSSLFKGALRCTGVGHMPTAYSVITIEREYGAGGSVIAAKLAERLGWKLYDQELTADIARIAQVDPKAVARCDEQMRSLALPACQSILAGQL